MWADVADIASHVDWMADAEAIRFTSVSTSGTGTTFDCDTRIGPLRLTDKMTVTSWEPGRGMGVRHVGAVVGEGRFSLTSTSAGTRFTWSETLIFPWWLGGPIGALAARPIFTWIWVRNLRRLKERIETAAAASR